MKAASLNHVYRLVWSHVQNAWTVVAETARSKGKKSLSVSSKVESQNFTFSAHLSKSAKLGLRVSLGVAALTASAFAYALPSDAKLEIGHATFDVSNNGTTLDINQTTSALKASWHSFNIGSNETVNLNQHAGDRAMFIITGPDASQIAGKFNVSNMLLFVNPNGIYFAKGSEVNVGSIILSTLKITDDDFLAGRYKFAGTDNMGSIVNHGVIKAKNEGYIVLLGKSVENTGTLVANNGSVVLGSAKEATLDFFGNGLIKAKLSGDALEANIKNSGAIHADGGFVQMATNARASAINISGIVEANQLVERDGVIRLEGGDNAKVEVSGRLIAKGLNTTGGSIEVTGEQVALMNGAVLDASGDKGGGKVLVGGDYQGKNDAVYNARTTYVASGASIKADAIQEGNGGKVVVWANDLTRYYGNISAQGAATKGNGGFVEVSGKQYLTMLGNVNVGALNGIGGTVLFDPTDIIVGNTSSMVPADVAGPDVAFANNTGGATTLINVNDVKGFSELYLQADNDITVSSPLGMTQLTGSINMEAKNNINVNAEIKSGILGSINLKADSDNTGTGDININANIIGGVGGVSLTAVNVAGAGNITTTGTPFVLFNTGTKGGDVSINANGLNMTGSINTQGSLPNKDTESGGQGGLVTINTVNNLTVGSITTSAGDAGSTSVSSTLSGDVSLTSSAGNITTGNINANGGVNNFGANVTMNAAGEIKTGDINTSAGVGRSDTDGKSAGAINITAGTSLIVGTVTASGADGNGTNKSGGVAGAVNLLATTGDATFGDITNNAGAKTGTGVNGNSANIFVRAGQDVIQGVNQGQTQTGSILTTSTSADAVTLVAGRNYINTNDKQITTGTSGRWLIYSTSPASNQPGSNILANVNFQQFGTSYDAVKSGTQQLNSASGNGLIYTALPATPPTTTTALLTISPRDNAGLGGLVGTNPALNTMTIVSLNPAAGDDEDPDAVACPVNEDHLGSTPILSSGVKLPDGVNSNCI